jgi:NAD(P)-dependent dehydrogenase (short-subunit alcohol dehydrogenase family)
MGVRVVLVTNVGQGFGRAIALAYGQADFDVVCADKDVTLASKTAAEIEELGGQAIPIQADMSAQLDVRNTFEKIFEIFGDLSGVVHVAAFESNTRFHDLGEGEFSELLDENLKSTFLVLKASARLLTDAWVVIVSPPRNATEPHMVAVRGAITSMATGFEARAEGLSVNVAVPSRAASDPKHDAALVENVRYLGSRATGLSGHRLYVTLPPPPKDIESLLPEVRAALDSSVRQDDLEASVYDADDAEDDPDETAHDGLWDDSEDDLDEDLDGGGFGEGFGGSEFDADETVNRDDGASDLGRGW